ncbi:hypothetical protein HHI36_005276 [Cryptolaemus montrouzieri]|uniref:Uncharacterized protein n=1 Tax=Cryptolaemus montrouzieri TaxID=559131 RepID=A0ABD2NU67_9CUCU
MEYDQLSRDEKSRHFKETILSSDNKTERIWNIAAEIKGHQKTTNIPIEGDPKLLADQSIHSSCNIPRSEENLVFKAITKRDFLKMGELLKSKHSSGFDDVPSSIMKCCLEQVAVCDK